MKNIECYYTGDNNSQLVIKLENSNFVISEDENPHVTVRRLLQVMNYNLINTEKEQTQNEEEKDVDLRVAFAYDCDNCGRENFVRAVQLEDTETIEELENEIELVSDMVVAPAKVKCYFCNAQYNVPLI